ncbi:hypothetical protein AVEN_129105-1 [Araneus ventricosus]|uniref:Uncharacterized protein n=1 Tax=Araneus ventricosus TaxID=182803 RepID=A0A4Y2HH76_ARAVE|nr:hypothetical protein AVEN_129105-1 [Araneus ventricosus]
MASAHLFLLVLFAFEVIGAKVPRFSRSSENDFGDCAGFCWCRRDSLTCQRSNTLDSIPILSSEEERALVTKMNQRVKRIDLADKMLFSQTQGGQNLRDLSKHRGGI